MLPLTSVSRICPRRSIAKPHDRTAAGSDTSHKTSPSSGFIAITTCCGESVSFSDANAPAATTAFGVNATAAVRVKLACYQMTFGWGSFGLPGLALGWGGLPG